MAPNGFAFLEDTKHESFRTFTKLLSILCVYSSSSPGVSCDQNWQ